MTLLKRELYRQVKGPEVTHADCCTLVFDTDAKNLYVEREVAYLDASVNGAIEIQTATMDIANYLKQGGQTAGHRELWRLLRSPFEEDSSSEGRFHFEQRVMSLIGSAPRRRGSLVEEDSTQKGFDLVADERFGRVTGRAGAS